MIFEPLYRGNGPVGDFLWVILTFIAFVLNIYRLVNWRFVDSFKVKILFILYFSYLWIPIHFALNLALYFSWISDLGRVDLHALSYGCMGIMIFGMVHRVTLGHTGRKIYASGLSLFGYISIGFGALIRVFGPLCSPLNYILWVKISGVLWIVSFILLGIEIVPMLVCERVDKRV